MKLQYKKILGEMLMQLYIVEHKSSSIPSMAFTHVSGDVIYSEVLPICKCFWIGLTHNWSFFCKALSDGQD